MIYADNAATTRISDLAFEKMVPFLREQYGNASSQYSLGVKAKYAIEQARQQAATAIGAEAAEITFTSGGSEANSWVLRGVAEMFSGKAIHILTSSIEHHSVLNACHTLKSMGAEITYLPVNGHGTVEIANVISETRPNTKLVSIMLANNEIGTIQPITEIGKYLHERDILFHTDAVQAAGKIPINLKNNAIDMLSISGHKLHAPKGIGVLYVRKGTKFSPFLIGGHQERGRRGGTENSPSIIGLGKASELAAANMEKENTYVKALRDKLQRELLSRIPQSRVNGDTINRLPNTTNISFEFVEGEAILLLMNELGICASSGSACTSGSLQPSHVLRAMGVPFTMAHGSIRFSLSIYNKEEEVDFIIDKMPAIIERLRGMSPFWKKTQ